MKDVKYNLDPSVLLETFEKLKSDEEYGCSNSVDHPVTTVYPEFSFITKVQTKQNNTHTPHNTKTNTRQPGSQECWLTLAQVRIYLQKKWRQLRRPLIFLQHRSSVLSQL